MFGAMNALEAIEEETKLRQSKMYLGLVYQSLPPFCFPKGDDLLLGMRSDKFLLSLLPFLGFYRVRISIKIGIFLIRDLFIFLDASEFSQH